MMQCAWAVRVVALMGVLGCCFVSVARASEPASERTARILGMIEDGCSMRTPAGAQAAGRLNAEGDRAYRKQDYSAAARAYRNSYPNDPNAYAYIMEGDAHWRAVVQHHESLARKPGRDRPACSLDNRYFARDLALDVARHHEVGLALAEKANDRRFMESMLYRRVRESAACLQDLARHYEAQPPSACVDLARLRRCLGSPLIA